LLAKRPVLLSRESQHFKDYLIQCPAIRKNFVRAYTIKACVGVTSVRLREADLFKVAFDFTGG